MRSEESVEIDRPPEEVFSYVANPENLPEWTNMVLEVRKDAEGQPQEGDRFSVVAKFLGRRFETPFEVSAHEPPRQHADRSTGGPFEQEFIYTFEQTADGKTRLTVKVSAGDGQLADQSFEHSDFLNGWDQARLSFLIEDCIKGVPLSGTRPDRCRLIDPAKLQGSTDQ